MTHRRAAQVRFWPLVALAVGIHLFILLLPVLLTGHLRSTLGDGRVVIFLVLLSTWLIAESMAAQAREPRPRPALGSHRLQLLSAIAVLVSLWVCLLDVRTSQAHLSVSLVALGSMLMAVGMLLRVLAIRTLGPFFLDEVAVLPGQPLVTGGVYGYLRHPSEGGTLSIAIGAAVLMSSVLGIAVVVLVLGPLVIWRIWLEDRLLERRFNAAFLRYAREAPALLPRIGGKCPSRLSREWHRPGSRPTASRREGWPP